MTPAGVRVALVTGANRGLGFETSRQLLAKGLRVVLAGRDDRALERAVDELGADAERAMTVRMDVTDVTSITRAHRVIDERFGAVDVLVNNAAVLEFENEDALSIPADAYRRTFETNVFAVRASEPSTTVSTQFDFRFALSPIRNHTSWTPLYSARSAALGSARHGL